jgi:hypothetical protein
MGDQGRDIEILRLRKQGLPAPAIAAGVGCSPGLVREILNPKARRRWNERRRAHWRVYSGGKAA